MLNFGNGGGGNYKPYVKYLASTSSWATRDGAIQLKKAIFDLENIRTGWCLFTEGGAPEWVMDESIEKTAARPDGEGQWKRGFKVHIFSAAAFGDEEPVAEWATNAAGATMSIQKLYADYEAGKEAGKVPVVEFQGAVPVKVGKGNTTVPTLVITKWVDRPAELNENEDTGAAAPSLAQPVASAEDEF